MRPVERYADRFERSTYADEPVGVFEAAEDADALWVPERLFQRLVAVARGYELHLLPLLGGPDPVTLNYQQLMTLREEVGLVGAMLRADPLATATVEGLDDYLRRRVSRPDVRVTVEGG